MILLDYNPEVECLNELMQAGTAVNSPGCLGQTPAHLAAFGGQAYCLLWFLHAGTDVNQQDDLGEAAIHKAAKTGSLQCISLLVASAARIELCNCAGQTAEDLALSHGHADCVNFLATIRTTRSTQPQLHDGQLPANSRDRGGLVHRPAGYKRMCGVFEADKKKAKIDGIQQSNKEFCKGGRTEHLLSLQEVRSL
ncbi:ankyrin repeat domain-containing protein 37 [Callorhinchus milii]|uniref:Ankyrin repeat domain 37 n=1 Tax=Callorhinchus milii TaxID=7868 RepID=V9KVL5_CALMI|nr:ankyrin repeat domain-containing protein 37 [Callorhinchus milii]|eukprot:gi/632950950/ref/XP_007891017.1/ PREDICTED: ankyrin repeat domain-containing protein 37 [Callorhinchus milii]